MVPVLTLVWMMALALVALSFGVLAALIGARLRRRRVEAAELACRARISKELTHYAMFGGAQPALAVDNRRERGFIVVAGLDAMQVLHGPARERLVDYFDAIGLDKRLRRQVRRGPARDRLNAIEALRLFGDADTVVTLKRLLKAPKPRIWLAALRTLMEIEAGPDIFDLLDLAERPGAGKTHIMFEAIRDRARSNLPEAMAALRGDLSSGQRVLLIRAIGETGRIGALPVLKAALSHDDPEVRSAAARSIGDLGVADSASLVVAATRDPDWRVRLRACESIGRLGAWKHALSLEPLLEDPVWWVRFRAEEALTRINEMGADSLKAATALLNRSAHAIVRSPAAAA